MWACEFLTSAVFCSSQPRPLYEGQYEWVREYTYAVQNEQAGGSHSYVFRFTPDAVRYLDLGTRLTVQKRSKLKDKDSLQSHRFARPAEVCRGRSSTFRLCKTQQQRLSFSSDVWLYIMHHPSFPSTRLLAQITIKKRSANDDEELMRETKLRHLMAELEDPAPATQTEPVQPSQPSLSDRVMQIADAEPDGDASGLGGSDDADEDPLADDSFDDLSD